MNTVVTSLHIASEGAGLRAWLAQAGLRTWRSLEAAGRARAERHLLDYARQCEAHQPELARELRAASIRAGQA